MEPFAVIVGGALGGIARFWLADLAGRRWGASFPLGILLVNASGAVLAGAMAALGLAGGEAAGSLVATLLVTGFLGSYTTVSSFSLQTLALLHDGAIRQAAWNVAASLVLAVGGVALGWALASRLLEVPA